MNGRAQFSERGHVPPAHAPVSSPPASSGPELLTQVQVCARLGISDQTWMRWRKAGRAPLPVALPSGRLKWLVVDIDRLIGVKPEPEARRRFFSAALHRCSLSGPRAIPQRKVSGEAARERGAR